MSKLQIIPEIDMFSLSKGDVSRFVIDPVTKITTDYLEAGVDVGESVLIRATVINTETDFFVGWFLDGETVPVATTEEYEIVASEPTITYTAKFGGTVTVTSPTKRFNQTPEAETDNASAGASVPAPATPSPKQVHTFTFGDAVRLIAVSGTNAIFSGWYNTYTTMEQSAQRMDLSADCEIVPTDSFSITPVFSYSAMKHYIRMTNSGAYTYGALLISSINDVSEIDESQFSSSLFSRYGSPSGNPPIGSEIPDEQSGLDRFFELDSSGQCTIQSQLFSPDTVLFRRWMIAQIVPTLGGGYKVSPKTELASTNVTVLNIFSDCVIYAEYLSDEASKVIASYDAGSGSTMGTMILSPTGLNHLKGPPVQADYFEGNIVNAVALPMSGYRFVGWYSDEGWLISKSPEYVFVIESSGRLITLLARFEQDSNAIYEWEGDTTRNKLLEWESKRFKSSVPFNPVCTRVYADKYADTTKLKVRSGTSPEVDGNSREAVIVIRSQDVRRLPIMRPEKYTSVEIQSASTVTEISVSTSMEGLLNG